MPLKPARKIVPFKRSPANIKTRHNVASVIRGLRKEGLRHEYVKYYLQENEIPFVLQEFDKLDASASGKKWRVRQRLAKRKK